MNGNRAAAPTLLAPYTPAPPAAPSNWSGQIQPMLPASHMGFGQLQHNPQPWASAYPPPQVPQYNQMGFQPNTSLTQSAQQNCCSNNGASESGFGMPNPLTLGELDHSSPAQASSSESSGQSAETNANGGTPTSKESEEAMLGHGQLVNNAPQTTVYSMPSDYATATNPLTPEQLALLQQGAQLYSFQVPQHAPNGVSGSVAPSAEYVNPQDIMHECNCGPSCECLVCLVHPFNQTSMERIGEMADLMTSESTEYGARSRPQSWYEDHVRNAAMSSGIDAQDSDRLVRGPEGTGPSQAMMTGYPAGASNALPGSEAPSPYQLHSRDYVTMQYTFPPVGANMCSRGNVACRCGDSCGCMGCRTHTGHYF